MIFPKFSTWHLVIFSTPPPKFKINLDNNPKGKQRIGTAKSTKTPSNMFLSLRLILSSLNLGSLLWSFQCTFSTTVFENSSKKSHWTLRAKRAKFTIWVDKKFIKNAKNGWFGRVFGNLKFAVIQCYQTGHFLSDKNKWKTPKLENKISDFQTICQSERLTIL